MAWQLIHQVYQSIKGYFCNSILTKSTTLFILGNLYISECEHDRVRKLTASNSIITTIAGGGTDYYGTFKGDNGAATSATLYVPRGIALDSSGKYNIL